MKTEFEPRLIGRNQEAINARLETWQTAVQLFNELATDWNQTATTISMMWATPINANFDLPVFRLLLKEKFGTLEKFIKVYFINCDLEYAKFSKRIKIEETLKQTEFPDLTLLMATLQRVKTFAIDKIPPIDFEKYINQIWDGNGFIMSASIVEDCEKEFTYHTSGIRENLVFEIASQLAATLNLLNSLGCDVSPRDLPLVIEELITSNSTGKTKAELHYYQGEGKHHIMQITPGFRIKQNISIYRFLQNLTDKEVDELYNQLTDTKNT